MKDRRDSALHFSPHWTETCKAANFIPAAAGGVFLTGRIVDGVFSPMEISVAAAGVMLSLFMLLLSGRMRRQTRLEIGSCIRLRNDRGEKVLMYDGLEYVEICGSAVARALGGVRVRLYSDSRRKAWLSVMLAKESAETLRRCIAEKYQTTDEDTIGKIMPGRHSAAAYAITSERTVLLLIASAQFTLLGGKSPVIFVIGSSLLIAAVLNIVFTAAHTRGLSLIHTRGGYDVSLGFFGGKRLFLPENSVVGTAVHCGPASAVCGAGTVWLICRSGRRIPCVRWLSSEEAVKTALRLIDKEAGVGRGMNDTDTLRGNYSRQLAAALFCSFLCGLWALRAHSETVRFVACVCGIVMNAAVLRGCVGLKYAAKLGLQISPSAVCAGGSVMCGAEHDCIKRDCIAGLRINSTVFQRMNNLCSARLFTKGRGAGVWCRCVSYSALNGFAGRFG